MEERCLCGKLKKDHYRGQGNVKGGEWCHKFDEIKPEDVKYGMRFTLNDANRGKDE